MSRNEPCPCGSGKKYKKCCQQNQPTQLTDILSSELAIQQEEMLYFAYEEFEDEVEEAVSSYPTEELPEEAVHILEHFLALNCLFSYEKAIEDYLIDHGNK
ncbi:YecA family protein [Bacillus pinisoli]|uniref:YecA family protein n=1 Tax=Bacillus pinisoli TaxID=2901866 RepID=UPI001FF5C624|nr:SEC-C metal-binding domain-containing protein [Bacillus pinisoli]